MEQNYRSTPQIVSKAQQFISQNKDRYEKKMIADRDSGEEVHLETVPSREAQYLRLLDVAKSAKAEIAFLYRDNESSVALLDIFLRNHISFKLRKPEMNFINTRIVKDQEDYLIYDVVGFRSVKCATCGSVLPEKEIFKLVKCSLGICKKCGQ